MILKVVPIISIALCIGLVCSVPSDKVISGLEKCRFSDSKCIEDRYNYVVRNYKHGNPSLGLPPLDPFRINSITIKESTNSTRPVKMNLYLKDIDMYGLSNATLSNLIGYNQDPSAAIDSVTKIPSLKFKGKYKMDGQILIVPIQGEGDYSNTLEGVTITGKYFTKVNEQNGKRYLQFTHSNVDMKITGFKVRLENLFNGDRLLGETTNQFLNENWRDIYREMKPAIQKSLDSIVIGTLNNIFRKHSYDDLFIG